MKVYWTGDAIVLAELAASGASSMLAYVWAVGGLCPLSGRCPTVAQTAQSDQTPPFGFFNRGVAARYSVERGVEFPAHRHTQFGSGPVQTTAVP
jgi:hypothetical protein